MRLAVRHSGPGKVRLLPPWAVIVVRRLTTLFAGGLLLLSACTSPSASPASSETGPSASAATRSTSSAPLPVHTTAAVKPWVTDARLTRTLLAGAVTLVPTNTKPRLDEGRAVRLWDSGGTDGIPGGAVVSADVVVALVRASVSLPGTGAMFGSRDAWVIMWNDGDSSCPNTTSSGPSASGQAEIPHIALIAADDSGVALDYSAGYDPCAPTVALHPTAAVAAYGLSVPWLSAANGKTTAVLPVCASVGSQSTLGTRSETTFTVGARVPMTGQPCVGTKRAALPAAAPRGAVHAPTGLLFARISSDTGGMTYYDGQQRSLSP